MKIKRKLTVTVGIPAYNEEANITYLLKDVLRQKGGNLRIEKIIVASDGSTDRTVSITKRFKDKRILLLDNKDRKGQTVRQNQIIDLSQSDVLVLLNADIVLHGRDFISKLIEPIVNREADLTSSNIVVLKPRNLIEKALQAGSMIKDKLFLDWRDGSNVYTCRGAARAFSKKLYMKFRFLETIGEDSFSYFYCINKKITYKYVRKAIVYLRLPNNIKDHTRQSVRFEKSKQNMKKIFGEKVASSEYAYPKVLLIKSILHVFWEKPIGTVLYILLNIYTKLVGLGYKQTGVLWEVSESSKTLR